MTGHDSSCSNLPCSYLVLCLAQLLLQFLHPEAQFLHFHLKLLHPAVGMSELRGFLVVLFLQFGVAVP